MADQQDNVFATWEWASVWWRHYGRDQELFVHQVLDSDGHVIGILPLYVSARRFAKLLRFIGHGPADELGPVCHPAHRKEVAAALRGLVDGPRSPGILLAERMRADHAWLTNVGGRPVKRESFWLIDLEGLGWEDWLATKSANFRQQTRKAERRLARAGRLDYRLVTDGSDVADALNTMIELHDARWHGRSIAFSPRRRAFHHDFAQAAANRGWLRLWFAEVDGKPVAASLGYRFADVQSSYLMGRAPAWDKRNVGAVLRMHTIREAAPDIREYRLLGGNEPYKQRLATGQPGVDTCLVGTGPLPRIAQQVIQHKRFLPSAVRRALASQLSW